MVWLVSLKISLLNLALLICETLLPKEEGNSSEDYLRHQFSSKTKSTNFLFFSRLFCFFMIKNPETFCEFVILQKQIMNLHQKQNVQMSFALQKFKQLQILCISPYSLRMRKMREKCGPEYLRIRTLFTQCMFSSS